MSSELSGRIALVTGASRGIGAAVAKAVAGAGAHVVLLARTSGGLEEVDDEIRSNGGQATLIPLDLRKLEEVDKLGPSIVERFGRLDILIGNAAILGPLTPAHQVDPKDWKKVMAVNFMANVRLMRTLDPLLRASDAGRAVFPVASVSEPMAYWGPYMASKAALSSFARTYAAETQKTNLKINLIKPGIVETDMLAEAFPGGFDGDTKKPEDVAPAFVDLVSPACQKHGEVVMAS